MKRIQLVYVVMLSGLLGCGVLTTSCNNPQKTVKMIIPAPSKPVLMEPFRYHKMIEVSPGQDYDILSWGRGLLKTGAFEILHSDSSQAKYTTTTGDLDGVITDVFNTDMDLDGNPEILIQAKGNDTINFTHIYAFEFTDGKAEKLEFPKLTKQQRQGYRGGDNFYVTDGKLERVFPVYDSNVKTASPTSQKRRLEYGLRNNEFTVKQIITDSAKVRPVAEPVVKKKEKNTASANVAPKKHKGEKSHRKKHRRHHHDED